MQNIYYEIAGVIFTHERLNDLDVTLKLRRLRIEYESDKQRLSDDFVFVGATHIILRNMRMGLDQLVHSFHGTYRVDRRENKL